MTDSVTWCIVIGTGTPTSWLASVQLHNSCALTQFQQTVNCTLDTVSIHICSGLLYLLILTFQSVAGCFKKFHICSHLSVSGNTWA